MGSKDAAWKPDKYYLAQKKCWILNLLTLEESCLQTLPYSLLTPCDSSEILQKKGKYCGSKHAFPYVGDAILPGLSVNKLFLIVKLKDTVVVVVDLVNSDGIEL